MFRWVYLVVKDGGLAILQADFKQWGLANKTETGYSWNFTYPLAFSSFGLPVFTPYYPDGGSSVVRSIAIPAYSKTGCTLRTDATGATVKGLCIIVGK